MDNVALNKWKQNINKVNIIHDKVLFMYTNGRTDIEKISSVNLYGCLNCGYNSDPSCYDDQYVRIICHDGSVASIYYEECYECHKKKYVVSQRFIVPHIKIK